MADLRSTFEAFHSRIALNPDRVERVAATHADLRARLNEIPQLRDQVIDTFLQGSYAHHTVIRPRESGFDVDVVVLLKEEPFFLFQPTKSPKKELERIAGAVESLAAYRGKTTVSNHCVRLDFARGLHLDLVPAYPAWHKSTAIKIPDVRGDTWLKTDPRGFRDWCRSRNEITGGQFLRVVKMLKWWRDVEFGRSRIVKSILLESIAGMALTQPEPSDAAAVVKAFEGLKAKLIPPPLYPLFPLRVENPTLQEENLARGLSEHHLKLLHERFQVAVDLAQRGLAETDPDVAFEHWAELFGSAFEQAEAAER